MPNNPQPIPAAPGYPQYEGTGFIPPIYLQRMLDQYYCESLIASITTMDYIGEIKGKGSQVTFYRAPLIRTREYVKDGALEHDTLELEPITIGINKARYWDIKVDQLDEWMSPMWQQVMQVATENGARAFKQDIDREVLAYMVANVAAANQGPNAGVQSGAYNLGQVGSPVALNATNIVEVLTHLAAVLDEQCVPSEGRWVVLPIQAKTHILNSQLANASFMGGNGLTMLLNGQIPMQIAGFNIYISSFLPSQVDPSVSQLAYDIVAGVNDATAYADMLSKSRVINNDKDSWSSYYQALMVYGYDVIRPEALARLYAYFA